MLKRLSRAIAAFLLVAIGSSGWRVSPVDAEVGDSPQEGELIPYVGYQVLTWLERGQRRWYRLPYPGGNSVLGITLAVRKEDAAVRDAISLSVNIRLGRNEQRGEPNADWQGYGRLGFATTTSNTGDDRKFWLNNFGEGEMYYVLVRNESGRRLPIAITTRLNTDPSPYVLVTSDVPAPTPIPTASPPPTAVPAPVNEPAPEVTEAHAEIVDAAGRSVGYARLTQAASGVRIEVVASGLEPGLHGIHLHAIGLCEPPAFASAGGHLNPAERFHGLANPDGPHAGDLPNLLANDDGDALFEVEWDQVTLTPGPDSLLDADGSAIVIHADADDHWTDPAGNSGARVACGVIVAG